MNIDQAETSHDLHSVLGTKPLLSTESAADDCPWYAVRLFSAKLTLVTEYLEQLGLQYFIPMQFVDTETQDHHLRHQLRPVVRNLLFLKKTISVPEVKKMVSEAPFKISIYRKDREGFDYYEIPAKQMFEFQAMCNPEIAMREFLSEEQAKLKVGTPVYVKYGPLRGLSGRLVRSNKKYFLLKEIPGMGVMLKVARWCCKPAEVSEV